MIHALLIALAVSPVSVHVRVDGSGFLRFDHNSKLRYSSEATLIARDGVLQTTTGDVLVPRIHVPANCTKLGVNLDGQVFALSATGSNELGQMVLSMLPDKEWKAGMFTSSIHGPSSSPGEGLAGVIRSSVSIKGVPSTLVPSKDPLNLIIDGPGFFKIQQIDGSVAYTRKGAFQLDSLGNLVTSDNRFVLPRISFPVGSSSIAVDQDGTVTCVRPEESTAIVLGQLTVTTFPTPSGLSWTYRNLRLQTEASGTPIDCTPGGCGSGFIERGLVESSTLSFTNAVTVQTNREKK